MKRRTVLSGLGGLAASGAAIIGSGAFTSVDAERSVSVAVADDSEALVKLTAPNSLENGEYATGPEEGDTEMLSLHFDEDAAVPGAGVNDDAVTRFEAVFRIANQGTQFTRFGIDKSGLAHPDRWDFLSGIGAGRDPYGGWDEPDNVGPGLQPGGSFTVGVRIDTRGDIDTLGGGTIVVQARG